MTGNSITQKLVNLFSRKEKAQSAQSKQRPTLRTISTPGANNNNVSLPDNYLNDNSLFK